ncbi:DUF3649 domain-containing protein [Pseudoxanthomonas sp. UTMC 1351]|uniref:DUF3649 domain-containing protein n=1 Tax=Pseudoxanthomonas sp. UTMC 1351 TaxID=2695853 RepID=UPI0034CF1960
MRTATHPDHPDLGPAAKSQPRGTTRWGVASRVLAALFGGYFVAWGSTAFLTLVLPMSRVDRVVTASLLCFAVWCAAVVYAFAARSAWRAWWVLLAVGGVLNTVAYLFAEQAARI